MKRLLMMALLLLTLAPAAWAQVAEDKRPKPVALKPDLTIKESVWRIKPRSVLITVVNAGAGAAAQSIGGYGCQGEPNEKGISLGFGGQFIVPALAPGQKFKVFLDCGAKVHITGAGVDSGKKIDESNEGNNALLLSDVK